MGESFIPLKCSFERLELFSESLQVLLGELPISFHCKKQFVFYGFMDEAGGTHPPSSTEPVLRVFVTSSSGPVP